MIQRISRMRCRCRFLLLNAMNTLVEFKVLEINKSKFYVFNIFQQNFDKNYRIKSCVTRY